jgi:lipopolysaccharide cholinephosphotransferase
MSKIRDSRTTFIEPLFEKIPMHHGLYIDLFPLDGYPLTEAEIKKFEKKKIQYDRHRMVKYCYNRFSKGNIRHPKAIVAYLLYKIFGFWKDTSKVSTEFHSYAASFWCEDSKLWCNYGNWQGHLEYAPKEQYGEGVFVEFEGLKVRIPEKYDEYLTQKYGDWRADLPVELQFNPHHVTVSDLDKPYTEYM